MTTMNDERAAFESWWKLDAEGSENKAAAYEGWKARAAYAQGDPANQREAFEADIQKLYPSNHCHLLRRTGEDYQEHYIVTRWEGWQAGAAWQRTQGEVPDGWNEAMADAGFAALEKRGFRVGASDMGIDDLKAVFLAMLAAAPSMPDAQVAPAGKLR